MAKEDQSKTAFRSVIGIFEYNVMPIGLKGVPATFQTNINAYLREVGRPRTRKGVPFRWTEAHAHAVRNRISNIVGIVSAIDSPTCKSTSTGSG